MTPAHCGADSLCMEGVCYYALGPGACLPGTQRCDGALLLTCADDASEWIPLQNCSAPTLCKSTGDGAAECLEPLCVAGQLSCDGSLLKGCNSDRTGWEVVDVCLSAAHCDSTAATCRELSCEPGQLRCNVGRLERCNDRATAWEVVDECETNQLCESARTLREGGMVDAPAACPLPVCSPGEFRCTGALLELCNVGQTGWEVGEHCGRPDLCERGLSSARFGDTPRCPNAFCEEGDYECTPEGVLTSCNEALTSFEPVQACIGPVFCNEVLGRCDAAPCEPGEMQCNGRQPQVCRADGTGFDPVGPPCATQGLCNDDDPAAAICLAPVCGNGEHRCVGAVLEGCNEQRTGFTTVDVCQSDEVCVVEEARCEPLQTADAGANDPPDAGAGAVVPDGGGL